MRLRTVVHLDDNHALRATIKELFEGQGWAVLSFASLDNLRRDLASIKAQQASHNFVGLFDVRLSASESGITAFREVKAELDIPVIFLSGEAEVADAITALKEGASDFLLKPIDLRVLIDHVSEAFDKSSLPLNSEQVSDRDLKGLTLRERQVFVLVARGLRGSEIGADLNITERTVKMHRANLMRKLKAKNIAHLSALYQILRSKRRI